MSDLTKDEKGKTQIGPILESSVGQMFIFLQQKLKHCSGFPCSCPVLCSEPDVSRAGL